MALTLPDYRAATKGSGVVEYPSSKGAYMKKMFLPLCVLCVLRGDSLALVGFRHVTKRVSLPQFSMGGAMRSVTRWLGSMLGVGCAPILLAAQAPRAMGIVDMINIPSLSDPQLSPDGRTVAYVRTTTDVESGRRNADIYVVAADGSSGPKRLVGGDRSENTPQFSPDGKKIAFASDRTGTDEIWICDADGTNPIQVTNFGGPVVGSPRWSPDGKQIVFDVHTSNIGHI